jgi:CheY-like chemotaxis protein
VYLWGTVVEHKLGWRAQFAYPKTLVVGPESLEELESLKILVEYGADLFLAGEKGNVPLWTKQCRGFDHVREVAARLAQSRHSERLVRLVIVEDEPALRNCLRSLLEAQPDYKVVGETADGDEAVQLARQLKPDILLTDVAHPGLTGMEVVRELNTPANPTPVRVIMLTARDRKSDIVEALQLGARGYVVKPFAVQVLLKAIRTVMAGEYWVLREPASNLEPYLRNA